MISVTQPAPKKYPHWEIWATQPAPKKYPHWVLWVTQPAPKNPSLSDLSNSTRSEKIPSLSDLSNLTRSEKNTHSLRFPYTHAYQYKYRIPRKCKTNNKLFKVVQILGKIVQKKKKKKKTDPLAKWRKKAPSFDSTGKINNRQRWTRWLLWRKRIAIIHAL